MEPCESFQKASPQKGKWKSGGVRGINKIAVSRGGNELIGEFKMAAGDVISIRTFQQGLKCS